MRDLSTFNKIYLVVTPVDFRRQAHGLALIIKHLLEKKINSEKMLFVFTNKRKNAIKLLYWDATGFALWWKTLEKDRFKWPKDERETKDIKPKELRWLLEGIDFSKIKRHKKLFYD